MMKSYTEALRQIVFATESACLTVFRLGGGTETGIADVLNSAAKLTMALRAARLTVAEIERLVEPLSKPGLTSKPASWSEIQNIMMAHATNTGKFK